MKILISYSYSHKHSSAGKRCRILNKNFLIKSDWTVYTSAVGSEVDSNCEVISTFLDRNYKPISYSNNKKKRSIKKLLSLFLWPDRGVFWAIKSTLQIYKAVRNSKSKVRIVSVCYPFSSILLGSLIKKIFKDKVYLISHFIDGFYLVNKGNDVSRIWGKLSYFAERFVINQSDKTLVCIDKKESCEQIFPNLLEKIKFVPTMIGIFLNNDSIKKDSSLEKNSVHLAAGSLYAKIRNPKKVLDLYLTLEEFNLNIAGNLNDTTSLVVAAKHVDYLGLLNEDELIVQLQNASILVNIDNQDGLQQSPGKIVEYMELQKKIINFYLDNSISQEILDKKSLVENSHININLNDDKDINIQKIRTFCDANVCNDVKLFEVEDTIACILSEYEV